MSIGVPSDEWSKKSCQEHVAGVEDVTVEVQVNIVVPGTMHERKVVVKRAALTSGDAAGVPDVRAARCRRSTKSTKSSLLLL